MQNISKFGLSERGFLPSETPIKVIDSKNSAVSNISELTNELPKLMLTNKLRTQINKFKPNVKIKIIVKISFILYYLRIKIKYNIFNSIIKFFIIYIYYCHSSHYIYKYNILYFHSS